MANRIVYVHSQNWILTMQVLARANDLRKQILGPMIIIFNLILDCAHTAKVVCIFAPMTAQALFLIITEGNLLVQ